VFDNVRFQIPLLFKTGHLAEPLNKAEWNRHFEIRRELEFYQVRELIRSHEYNSNYSWCEMFVSVPCLVSVVGALTWTSEQDLSKNLLFRVVFKMFRYSFSETMEIFPMQAASEMSYLAAFWRYLRLIWVIIELFYEKIYHNYQKYKVWNIFRFYLNSIIQKFFYFSRSLFA